mmetsp:Transcript_60660/g.167779  ORF Transcript_60660/g.167779 Transcript_60660/m.167779 type:complete len:235 (+) Transcript_60660:674-1378(+)
MAGFLTMRFRTETPPPQPLLQVPQPLQRPRMQFLLQDWVLQASASSVRSHGSPPCAAGTLTCLERCRTPPPHLAEQELHPLQAPNLQSTGQGCVLHSSVASSGGHAAPPLGATVTVRRSWREPRPQGLVHSETTHSLTAQSVMKTFAPSILYNSPRIFVKAQSSLRASFCSEQHCVMVPVNSFFNCACCRPRSAACDSDSICVFVDAARAVWASRSWSPKLASWPTRLVSVCSQ